MSATSYCEESGITHHGFPTRRWYADICINWGMRSNKQQELFFWQWRGREGGLDETLRVPNDYVFIFATEKEHNFQTDENIALLHLKRKKKTCLSSHRYFVVYCHRCPSCYFLPLQQLFRLVTQRHLFPVKERARSVMRLDNDCWRDCVYFRSSNREKIKIIRLKLVTSKI